MIANIKSAVLYGLVISLIIILTSGISGCRNVAPAASPASTGSSAETTPIPSQRQGLSGTPQSRPTFVPSPSTSSANTSGTPDQTPEASPSSAISTSIPTLSKAGSSTYIGSSPIILITMPLNVSDVPAGDITVSTLVSNFNLADKIGQMSASGEGHIVYYMDATPPILQSQPALTAAGTCVETIATSYTWHNVQGGFHYFSAQLVNNDSTPLFPAVTVTVYIAAQAPAPPGPGPTSVASP